jgi:hypothetical protein
MGTHVSSFLRVQIDGFKQLAGAASEEISDIDQRNAARYLKKVVRASLKRAYTRIRLSELNSDLPRVFTSKITP